MYEAVSLSDAVRDVRAAHHELIEEAAAWSAMQGRDVDPDLIALICAGAAGREGDGSLVPWDRQRAYSLLRTDTWNWCTCQGCQWPEELPTALWDWFGFLAETGRLADGSDPVWELRKPLICYGGLDLQGRPRARDDLDRLIPCECFLPYRATVEAIQGLLDGSRSVFDVTSELDPYDELRWARGRREPDDWPAPPSDTWADGESDEWADVRYGDIEPRGWGASVDGDAAAGAGTPAVRGRSARRVTRKAGGPGPAARRRGRSARPPRT